MLIRTHLIWIVIMDEMAHLELVVEPMGFPPWAGLRRARNDGKGYATARPSFIGWLGGILRFGE
jgi:hypothetical protein